MRTSSELSKRNYTEWIYPYLYYFDVSFDNREGIIGNKNKINGKSQIMLVPVGVHQPTVFQSSTKLTTIYLQIQSTTFTQRQTKLLNIKDKCIERME